MQFDYQLSPPTPAKTAPSARWMEVIKGVTLFGLTAYFVYNIIGGNLANYINIRFMWLSYVAVALFLLLGVVTLYSLLKKDYNNITSDHTSISWHVILIMAIPLVLGTLVPSQPLGASAIRDNLSFRALSFGPAQVADKAPLERNILDWGRAFSEQGVDPVSFDGLPADFIGFVVTEPTFPENHVVIARSIVRCCVVDIEGVGVPILWETDTPLRDDQWVRVQGTFQAGVFRDSRTPILIATSVEFVEMPEHPYLYP